MLTHVMIQNSLRSDVELKCFIGKPNAEFLGGKIQNFTHNKMSVGVSDVTKLRLHFDIPL
jgi:hypothetical protein